MKKGHRKPKKYEFTCRLCGVTFNAADYKAKLCEKCRSPKLCKCGCGEYTKSKGALYKAGHYTRGKTYLEIYGSTEVSCGYQLGEKNIAKQKEIRKKLSESIKKSYTPELRELRRKQFKGNKSFSRVSKNSQKFAWELYNKLSDEEKVNCKFADLNDEFIINDFINDTFYMYDFTLLNKKKIIEFHGDFWHMNPNQYNENDIHIKTKEKAVDIWNADKRKEQIAKQNGFNYLSVWESDLDKIEKSIEFLKL